MKQRGLKYLLLFLKEKLTQRNTAAIIKSSLLDNTKQRNNETTKGKNMTSINWYTGTTMTTAEIYDAYGFNTMTPCGLTVQDVVWEVITKGSFNPCINGVPVWGLPSHL